MPSFYTGRLPGCYMFLTAMHVHQNGNTCRWHCNALSVCVIPKAKNTWCLALSVSLSLSLSLIEWSRIINQILLCVCGEDGGHVVKWPVTNVVSEGEMGGMGGE